MTDSEKELVAWLRTQKSVMHLECASAIERLSAQVEDAKALLGGDGGMKTLRALREQVAALVRERDAARAERDRLRAALTQIVGTIGPFESGGDLLLYANMAADVEQIAMMALEAKHD